MLRRAILVLALITAGVAGFGSPAAADSSTPGAYAVGYVDASVSASGRSFSARIYYPAASAGQNAAVAATTGLLDALDRDEVAAVMAHELGHVRNRDTLVMTMVATIAGAISMIANFGLFFSNGENRPNPLAAIGAVILAPFAAMIVQMAISRTREFGADRAAAEISGDPRALARALAKIAGAAQRIPDPVSQRNPATAQLYIVPTSISEWFSTHPPTEKRIAALEALYTTTPAPGRVARRSALDPHSSDR